MIADQRLASALQALPLFPLQSTVFFPHTLLPLHVFEERYRQLTEHVLEGHGHLGVVWRDATCCGGPFAELAPVACVGRVVHHERLADGRYHVLVQGVARAALRQELPREGLLYHRALAERLVADDHERVDDELHALRACYARLLQHCPEAGYALGELPLCLHEPCVLADVACSCLLQDLAARQRALAEPSVLRRLRCANEALASLLLDGLPMPKCGPH
ncbi:MAG: LON peptidase substrate-binding domain-containing protein [Deltaproteobacteria bacterium]|nr:LON peptidase substrate-binding domain-containing protein [Deltaproteobacteria bacterium]